MSLLAENGKGPVEYIDLPPSLVPEWCRSEWVRSGYAGPGWYFFDEIWVDCHGPYPTYAEAAAALRRYAESLDAPSFSHD